MVDLYYDETTNEWVDLEFEKFYRLQEVIKQIETLETEKYNLKKELKIL